jgi:hypothetical protein
MSPEPSKEPSRFVLTLKWGGCFTASVFAVGGLLLDLAWSGDAYETLSRGSWIIVAISMGVCFTGVILDRSDELPKS